MPGLAASSAETHLNSSSPHSHSRSLHDRRLLSLGCYVVEDGRRMENQSRHEAIQTKDFCAIPS